MTREELDYIFINSDSSLWSENLISFSDLKESECYSKDNSKLSNKSEKPGEPKFKTAVKKVLKRFRLMSKGVAIEENLPNPNEIPVESPSTINFYSSSTPEESHLTKTLQGLYEEDICLNNSLSSKGFCILYQDIKTKNRVVADISNEFSCSGFFKWFSCYHLMPDSAQIIIFDINLQVTKAFHFLRQSNSRAAPIWDSEQNQIVCMLTITDFIKFLHKFFHSDITKIDDVEYHTIKDWINLLKNEENSKLIHISPESNLKKAISLIVQNGIHRLPVVDPTNGNLLYIITNFQIFTFFYRKCNQHNLLTLNFMSKTPVDLGLGQFDNLVSIIHPWQTVYEAFDIFINSKISVLPVVDEDNKLIDTYAKYDVVAFAESNSYKNLNSPISEVLNLRQQTLPPCICSPRDSLEQIIDIIYEAQNHRVFVLDDEGRLVGVVSLTDILAFLCET